MSEHSNAIMTKAYGLPLHIAKLEGPEGLPVWKREMRQHLVSILLFKWTKPENRERPAIPAPAPTDATTE